MRVHTSVQKGLAVCTVLVSLLIEACNPAPKYTAPAIQSPVAYKETLPTEFKESQGWKIAAPGDDKIRGTWWEIYGDPQLNAIEQQVKVSNQNIAAAEANFRQARALVVSAHSALLPVVTGGTSYNNSRFSSTLSGSHSIGGNATSSSALPAGGTTNTGVGGNEFALPIGVAYTFDVWHSIRNTISANAYQAQASAADVATALLSTQAEVAVDYFQVRGLDQERLVLADTIRAYRQALALTTSLFDTGIDSDENVSEAQTQLDTAIAQETDLGVSRAQFEHAIAVLTGKPPSGFTLAAAALNPTLPSVPVGLPSTLLERRPDIAAGERLIAAANAQIGVARAAYYPNLSLGGSAGLESSAITQWLTWPSRFWSLGPQFAGTIFDGGARRGLNEGAQAAYDAAVANYRQTVLTVFQSVEDNLAALRILAQEASEQRTAVGSAEHTLALATSRFEYGVDSYLNVIVAQTTVLTNREIEVQLQIRQMLASVQLIEALGGGWDPSELPQMKDLLAKPEKAKSEAPVSAPSPPVRGTK
jgi:NodT family efflux transporter outer membrane factor (OMF) lipoprotein